MAIVDSIQQAGLSLFGISMPVMARNWTGTGSAASGITMNEAALSLSIASGTWRAPMPGFTVLTGSSNKPPVTLTKPDGTSVLEAGLLFTIYPQAYLRLERLYVSVLETPVASPPAGINTATSLRPVPRYFFYESASAAANMAGSYASGEDLTVVGTLRIFDTDGFPIDPIAVAAAFTAIMGRYNLVQQHDNLGDAFTATHQIGSIAALASDSNVVRLRLMNADGSAFTNASPAAVTGISAVSGADGMYAPSGTPPSGTRGRLQLETDTTILPANDAAKYALGFATRGVMGNNVSIPTLPTAVPAPVLSRDFYSIRVLKLDDYLIGSVPDDYDAKGIEPRPDVRRDEGATLLADGNDVMGAAGQITASAAAAEMLVVAPKADNTFPLPASIGAAAHWPQFPALAGGVTADTDAQLSQHLSQFEQEVAANSTAQFTHAPGGDTPNVQLVMNGLPLGAYVRVFNRVFGADAVLTRGDGAGGVAVSGGTAGLLYGGTLTLHLIDPLGFHMLPAATFIASAHSGVKLRFDMVIVFRDGKSHNIGGMELTMNTSTTATEPTPASQNNLQGAGHKGISTAGILGLYPPNTAPPATVTDQILAALNYTTSANPLGYDASRLPTMARRDMLVASLATAGTTAWQALISGGPLTARLQDASPHIGGPGGPGGDADSQYTGAFTSGGNLAYDIARMALRRTNPLIDPGAFAQSRLSILTGNNWTEPPATPTPAGGTFAGAVLQNIAPDCETPELAALKQLIIDHMADIPANWHDLVDVVKGWITGAVGSLPSAISSSLSGPITTALNNLQNNAAGTRLYAEMRRELSSAAFGRRDTQWALQAAIKNARKFIYLETPGFSFTKGDYPDPANPAAAYTLDLLNLITQQITAHPGLKVIICTPELPDYAKGYEAFANREIADRLTAILSLPQTNVVSFHPMGYPGRSSHIETHTVVVDDLWMLTGSSAFRRRGLSFDGSSDMVCTDLTISGGASPVIRAFRKAVMAARLGITSVDSEGHALGATQQPRTSSAFVMLERGEEAFGLVREMLVAGGYGVIRRLYRSVMIQGETSAPSVDSGTANPEGRELNLAAAYLATSLAAGAR